jgi:hypothetical protein
MVDGFGTGVLVLKLKSSFREGAGIDGLKNTYHRDTEGHRENPAFLLC